MIAGVTSQYDKNTVILAGLGTALVTISLTLYAMFTKVEIDCFFALVWVVILAILPLSIIGNVLKIEAARICYCIIGLLLYSLYLIIDTIMICDSS